MDDLRLIYHEVCGSSDKAISWISEGDIVGLVPWLLQPTIGES